MFAQSMGMVIAELRAEWRQEIKRLERENIELRGKVDTLTTILAGGKTKAADVIELPPFLRRTHDPAA